MKKGLIYLNMVIILILMVGCSSTNYKRIKDYFKPMESFDDAYIYCQYEGFSKGCSLKYIEIYELIPLINKIYNSKASVVDNDSQKKLNSDTKEQLSSPLYGTFNLLLYKMDNAKPQISEITTFNCVYKENNLTFTVKSSTTQTICKVADGDIARQFMSEIVDFTKSIGQVEYAFLEAYPLFKYLSNEDVLEIDMVFDDVTYGDFYRHESFTDKAKIDIFLSTLKSSKLELASSSEPSSLDDKLQKIVISTNNNNDYELEFSQGYVKYRSLNYNLIMDFYESEIDIKNYEFKNNFISGMLYKGDKLKTYYELDLKDVRIIPSNTDVDFSENYTLNYSNNYLYFLDEKNFCFAYKPFNDDSMSSRSVVFEVVQGQRIINDLIKCANQEVVFYSLQEAFDIGLINHQDLETLLKNYQTDKYIEDQMLYKKIRYEYASYINIDPKYNSISAYIYGKFNDCYATMVMVKGINTPSDDITETIDGVTFEYHSFPPILIRCVKD